MKTLEIEADLKARVLDALSRSAWFRALKPASLEQVVGLGTLVQYEPDETIVTQGGPSDSFFLLLGGRASIQVGRSDRQATEVGEIHPPASFGEVGLLLGQLRTATVTAAETTLVLRFTQASFQGMFQKVPGFALNVIRGLASRLQQVSGLVPLPEPSAEDQDPSGEALALLPVSFEERHRVLPLRVEANSVVVGFVDDPLPEVLAGTRQLLPGMELRPVRLDPAIFRRVMQSRAGVETWQASPSREAEGLPPVGASSPRLDALLERVVAEGASDLHLSAGQKPRWRIDGDMRVVEDAAVLGREEVYELLEPVMEPRHREAFLAENDVDLAYSLEGVARFRVNVFRDSQGASAVLRQIPSRILSFEQLGLPPILKGFCDYPKGLVLVTGPTGSGKSTTLAAMMDHINRSRPHHIITLEDPVEFVYESQQCLVNQREVGGHTRSFSRALKAALREDPDIVLVGELRDLETISLALETANTGHLVFATLHTSSAVATVDRIVDMFPGDQQAKIRASLSDALKGVVCQTLLKKRGGGRIAAMEILVVNVAVANMIREGKSVQIPNHMQSQKAQGNRLLNEDLAALVERRKVAYEEALSAAVDKADLARRCGRTPAQA